MHSLRAETIAKEPDRTKQTEEEKDQKGIQLEWDRMWWKDSDIPMDTNKV